MFIPECFGRVETSQFTVGRI